MATITEVTQRPLSGLNHIDALLGSGQPWNYIGRGTIYYSFALDVSGDPNGTLMDPQSLSAFNPVQQEQARSVLLYLSGITGIQFTEVASAAEADIHFVNAALYDDYTSQNITHFSYDSDGGQVTSVRLDGWVYLDLFGNAEDNAAPFPVGSGYESLLHEMGHLLGLKHPFEGDPMLPPGDGPGQDNTGTTVMSWNEMDVYRSDMGPYDLAALMWLYGDDGLGGAYGAGSAGKAIMGTAAADILVGGGGPDRFIGSNGIDVFDGGGAIDEARFAFGLSGITSYGWDGSTLTLNNGANSARMVNVERVLLADGTFAALDTSPGGTTFGVYALWNAAFDNDPNQPQLSQWVATADDQLALGHDLGDVADLMIAAYGGPGVSNESVIAFLYENIVGRPADNQEIAELAAMVGTPSFGTIGDLAVFGAMVPSNTAEIAHVVGSIQFLDHGYF